jgi:hypothetical protein
MNEPLKRGRAMQRDPPDPAQDWENEHREALLDEALEESFPASDPPATGRTD